MPQDEFGWIREWTSRCPTRAASVVVATGDDAAVTSLPCGREQVSCMDTMTEGVHFRRTQMTMEEIGWKSVAVNFSDLAAMGADASGVLVAVAVPPTVDATEVSALYDGIGAILREYDAVLLGGDTVRGRNDFTVTVAALGSVPAGTAVTRAGARAGDRVVLTGPTGYSGSVWRSWAQGRTAPTAYRQAHTVPRPRLREGRQLRELGASAMNDVSDGLAADVEAIATASQVAIVLTEEAFDWLPELAAELSEGPWTAKELALYGGEDYELVATVPEYAEIPEGMRVIGRVETGCGVYWQNPAGTVRVSGNGFNHWQEEM